jgi:hypothetical protein
LRSRRQAGGRRRSREESPPPQAQLGREALQEIKDAMTALREDLERTMQAMVEAVAKATPASHTPDPVASPQAASRGMPESEDIITDHGKALERLQLKVGKILDIVTAERGEQGLEPTLSDVASLRGHTASSTRKDTAQTLGSAESIQEQADWPDEATASPTAPTSPSRRGTAASDRRRGSTSKDLFTARSTAGLGGGDTAQVLSGIAAQVEGLVKAQKKNSVEDMARMRREVQMELTEKTLRIQVLEAENKALHIDLEKKELELKIAVQERDKAVGELHAAQKDFKEKLLNEQIMVGSFDFASSSFCCSACPP